MTRPEIIQRMLTDYKKELEALSDEELSACYNSTAGIKHLSPEDWAKIKKAKE